jgi:hypothetical protein
MTTFRKNWVWLGRVLLENPSNFSNWVIWQPRGGLIIGGYPSINPPRKANHFDRLLRRGVDVFVSLVESPEFLKFGDYRPWLPPYVTSLWVPTPDRDITLDETVYQLVETIYSLIRQGHLVYTHCMGGHGRSGVIAILCLIRYYGWETQFAIDFNHRIHASRTYHPNFPTPQGKRQYSQVRRLASRLRDNWSRYL